jgi:hypothetical protein
MNLVEQKIQHDIAGSDSTGVKFAMPLGKGIQILSVEAWAAGTEATALEVVVDKYVDFGISTNSVEVCSILFPASNQQGNGFYADLQATDALKALARCEAGQAVVIAVDTASTADKDVSVVIRYIEDSSLLSLNGDLTADAQ